MAFAVPYASLIRVSDAELQFGGLTITYVLNHAPDTVTINIKNSGDATVATFAGTATQGRNSVLWDGTDTNAGGTLVAVATGYYVSITVDNNDAVALTKYAENLSGGGGGGQVFVNFSPTDAVTFDNHDSDYFGILLMTSSYPAGGTYECIQFTMDGLTHDLQDGTTDSGAEHPAGAAGANNGTIWGLVHDPDDENILWGAGQSAIAPQWYRVDVNSAIAGTVFADADDPSTPIGLLFPRDAALQNEGANKYLYYTRSNGFIGKVKITGSTLDHLDQTDNITSLTANTYSKDLEFDASGNLYWTSRSGAPAPRVYRWDSADVLAAPGTPLDEANATWVVDFPTTVERALGSTVVNGKLFTCTYSDDAIGNAIYEIGSTATGSIVGTAGETVGQELVSGADNPDSSNAYSNISADQYGNLFTWDRGSERLQCWSPGGNTSITVDAPSSQDFDIDTPPTGLKDWKTY